MAHRFGGKQVDFCDAVGISSSYLSLYITGKNGHSKILTLTELESRHGVVCRAPERHQPPLESTATAAARSEHAAPANLTAGGRGSAAEGGGNFANFILNVKITLRINL